MVDETQNIALPEFFDNHPEVKKQMMDYLKTVPASEKKKNLIQFAQFVTGEITWAEVSHISKRMQKEMARVAYLKFKRKEYDKAETMFKGLAVIDHTNWYYRAALGAVYQKQKKYTEAISEYSIALELKSDEVSCLVNRGECYLHLQDAASAEEDFDAVLELDLPEDNAWVIRTTILKQRMADQE